MFPDCKTHPNQCGAAMTMAQSLCEFALGEPAAQNDERAKRAFQAAGTAYKEEKPTEVYLEVCRAFINSENALLSGKSLWNIAGYLGTLREDGHDTFVAERIDPVVQQTYSNETQLADVQEDLSRRMAERAAGLALDSLRIQLDYAEQLVVQERYLPALEQLETLSERDVADFDDTPVRERPYTAMNRLRAAFTDLQYNEDLHDPRLKQRAARGAMRASARALELALDSSVPPESVAELRALQGLSVYLLAAELPTDDPEVPVLCTEALPMLSEACRQGSDAGEVCKSAVEAANMVGASAVALELMQLTDPAQLSLDQLTTLRDSAARQNDWANAVQYSYFAINKAREKVPAIVQGPGGLPTLMNQDDPYHGAEKLNEAIELLLKQHAEFEAIAPQSQLYAPDEYALVESDYVVERQQLASLLAYSREMIGDAQGADSAWRQALEISADRALTKDGAVAFAERAGREDLIPVYLSKCDENKLSVRELALLAEYQLQNDDNSGAKRLVIRALAEARNEFGKLALRSMSAPDADGLEEQERSRRLSALIDEFAELVVVYDKIKLQGADLLPVQGILDASEARVPGGPAASPDNKVIRDALVLIDDYRASGYEQMSLAEARARYKVGLIFAQQVLQVDPANVDGLRVAANACLDLAACKAPRGSGDPKSHEYLKAVERFVHRIMKVRKHWKHAEPAELFTYGFYHYEMMEASIDDQTVNPRDNPHYVAVQKLMEHMSIVDIDNVDIDDGVNGQVRDDGDFWYLNAWVTYAFHKFDHDFRAAYDHIVKVEAHMIKLEAAGYTTKRRVAGVKLAKKWALSEGMRHTRNLMSSDNSANPQLLNWYKVMRSSSDIKQDDDYMRLHADGWQMVGERLWGNVKHSREKFIKGLNNNRVVESAKDYGFEYDERKWDRSRLRGVDKLCSPVTAVPESKFEQELPEGVTVDDEIERRKQENLDLIEKIVPIEPREQFIPHGRGWAELHAGNAQAAINHFRAGLAFQEKDNDRMRVWVWADMRRGMMIAHQTLFCESLNAGVPDVPCGHARKVKELLPQIYADPAGRKEFYQTKKEYDLAVANAERVLKERECHRYEKK